MSDVIEYLLSTCRHCERDIELSDEDGWVDPHAMGDDLTWRIGCDAHDTFEMDHEPFLADQDFHWAVCPACHGKGSSSGYLGAYTQSDWVEMDDDWRDDYVRGAFDRPCDECRGRTTVRDIDPVVLEQRPDIVKLMDEWWRDEATERQERASGA